MNKLDSKKIMYYVLLVGLLALIVVYFLVYKKNINKTEELRTENATLAERVSVLKEYYDNKKMYEDSIEAMTSSINHIIEKYPADVLEEDILVLALDTMEESVVGYTGINIADRTPIYDIDRGVVGAARVEGLSDNITFVNRITQYTNTTDYTNLKLCISSILNSDNKKNIRLINYSSNEEDGTLEGTIEVGFYSVLGTGKPYVPVTLPDYEAGLFDLFGITTIEDNKSTGL